MQSISIRHALTSKCNISSFFLQFAALALFATVLSGIKSLKSQAAITTAKFDISERKLQALLITYLDIV